MARKIRNLFIKSEEGHTAAWGGGGILTIVLVIILLAWLF